MILLWANFCYRKPPPGILNFLFYRAFRKIVSLKFQFWEFYRIPSKSSTPPRSFYLLWEVGNPEGRLTVSYKDASGATKQKVIPKSVIDDYIQIHKALYCCDYPYKWWNDLNTEDDTTVGEASSFLLNAIQTFHSTCEKEFFTLANHTIPEDNEKEQINMVRTFYLDKLTDNCPGLAICRNWNTGWKDGIDQDQWWREIVRNAETIFIRYFSESKTGNDSESKKTKKHKKPSDNWNNNGRGY